MNAQGKYTVEEFDIPFVLGEETRPKVEAFAEASYSVEIQKSIFYKQYCTALAGIAELINYNGESISNDKPLHNNIFTFTGERGSGKTSCMLTVKELLCNDKYKKVCYPDIKDVNSDLKETLSRTHFVYFDIIDPIFFDNRHNILDLFIGTLFKNFQKYEEDAKNYNRRNESVRDKLISLFTETKRTLSALSSNIPLSEFDDLEQLNNLAASIQFKTSLNKLVQYYIEYMCGPKAQIILCIDDIDLNMSEGYDMIEQLRKYMNIRGLVILMAIKIDQLGNVIRIKYANDFKPLFYLKSGEKGITKRYDEIINEIVERYITKLFPINQRIQLPTIDYLLNQRIGIFQNKGMKSETLVQIDTLSPLKNGILRLIYKKIRLLAYNSRSKINYVIPQNLRELFNFIHLLYNMEDALDHKKAIPNLIRFKDYFYGVWCTNNLDENGLLFMRNTQNILYAGIVNQMVVHLLEQRFSIFSKLKEAKDGKDNCIKELINILDSENIMYNISLGDVLACLDWLDKVCNKEKDLKLLFAIKIFYSIFLYENFRTPKEILEEKKKQEAEIINRELLTSNETNYGDILNGNLFNSEYINVAPYEEGEISRCRRIINNKLIREYQKDNNCGIRKIADFFIMTTAFVLDSTEKPKTVDKSNVAFSHYRKKEEVYYEREVNAQRKYVCFDVLSIFYNLLDICKTYKRYDISIKELNEEQKRIKRDELQNEYRKLDPTQKFISQKELDEIIEKEIKIMPRLEMSPLYRDILDKINAKLPREIEKKIGEGKKEVEAFAQLLYSPREETLLYTLNIRNIEILEQISYKLQRQRPDGESDNAKLLQKVFKTLSEFKIKTYNESDIDFNFFIAISEFLHHTIESNWDFNGIYMDRAETSESSADPVTR